MEACGSRRAPPKPEGGDEPEGKEADGPEAGRPQEGLGWGARAVDLLEGVGGTGAALRSAEHHLR